MPTDSAARGAWPFALVAAAAAVAVALMPPIAQDPGYHRFADARPVLGVPNGWNALSNLPFLVAGLAGLAISRRRHDLPARPAWAVAFAGIALVGLGSAWYHLAPSDGALVWDRLPMTVGFMGLFAAVIGGALVPAVLAGIASIAWWQWTGDLRPYVWVQFTPLVIIAAAVARDWRRPGSPWLLAALVLYLSAKAFEGADRAIFGTTNGALAGHAIKHLAAALACACLVVAVQQTTTATAARS